jgi:hypothetical protein
MMSTIVVYFLVPGSIAEHPTQYSILCFREATLSYIALWLADAVGRVAFNDARLHGVKVATERAHCARGRSSATSDDGFSAQLLCLDRNPRLSGHNVLEDLVDVGEILNAPGPYERNDVTLDAASVGDDR